MAKKESTGLITGTQVQFVNLSQEAKKTLEGLARTALRDGGKIVRKTLRENIPMRSKRLKRHIASWARIDKTTGQPILEVGFYSWQKVVDKYGKNTASHANPHWIELGVNPHIIKTKKAKAMGYNGDFFGGHVKHPGLRATHVLRNAVYDNIGAIRAAQEELLANLNKTLEEAGAKIVETEEVEDD